MMAYALDDRLGARRDMVAPAIKADDRAVQERSANLPGHD